MIILALAAVSVVVVLGIITTRRPVPLAVGTDARSSVSDVLVSRFIDRSQRFRRSGAIVGVVSMLAYLIASASTGEDAIALDLIALVSIGLSGSIGGSLLAEGFRVRRRGPRIASLAVRDADTYRDRAADRREQVLLGLATIGVAGTLATGEDLARAVALGGVVVVLAGLRRWALRRIALRSRPVLPHDVEIADDEVRRLASSVGISRPMAALSAFVVSSQWGAATSPDAEIVSLVASLGSIGLFLVACRWWWTNRSFDVAPERLQSVGGPRSHLAWWMAGVTTAFAVMVALLLLARP